MADPSPATTLAIVAGASIFEKLPDLAQGANFETSAKDFVTYLRANEGLALPDKNILDLFDHPEAQSVLLDEMEAFLERRVHELEDAHTPPLDLIFYYLGHGGFTQDRKYRLAVRSTKAGAEDRGSIRMSDLARAINSKAGKLRKYLILDCCFSAAAFTSWQSTFQSTPTEVVRVQIQSDLPPGPVTGTTMLCSSSAIDPSEAPLNAQYTMFSGALIQALREGVPRAGARMSMAQLGDQVAKLIVKQYKTESVRPEVLCPDQHEDETKDIAIFPNPALRARNFDCTITVLDSERLALDYVNDEGKAEHLEAPLGDPMSLLTVKRLSQWINIGLVLEQDRTLKGFNESTDRSVKLRSSDDLRLLGTNLFRLLFGEDKLREAFCGIYTRFQTAVAARTPGLRMRLRLAFRRQAEEVARLPWEFLFVPDGDQGPLDSSFFAGRRAELFFTRHIPAVPRARQFKAEPLKILVAIYTPAGDTGMTPLEQATLLAKLEAIPNTKVAVVQDESLATLGKALESGPHVFHFIGFGARDGQGGLTFIGGQDDPEGRTYQPEDKVALPQSSEEVMALFSYDARPGVVFLHGWKTAGSPLDAFQRQESLNKSARDLMAKGIPTVVTMQLAIPNEEVGDFIVAAYTELARGNGPDEAIQAGREALGKIIPKWTHPRFAAPLVLMQNDAPLVLPPPKSAADDKTSKKEERDAVSAAGTVATTVASRPVVAETPTEVAPAAAPKDRDAGSSSFKGR